MNTNPDVFDIINYNKVSDLLSDIREAGASFDKETARVLIQSLLRDSRTEWFKTLLSETKGGTICDRLIEAALFEIPVMIKGSGGILSMVLTAPSFEIEVMSLKIEQTRDGLGISYENILPSEYSELVGPLCFQKMIDMLSEQESVSGKIKDEKIQVSDEILSFLDGMVIEKTTPAFVRNMLDTLETKNIHIDFNKSGDGLKMQIKIEPNLDFSEKFSSWSKIKLIGDAGSDSAVILGPGVKTSPPKEAPAKASEKSSSFVSAAIALQTELINLAQSLEHMRSVEASRIGQGGANTRIINNCMIGISQAKKIVQDVRAQGENFNFHRIENEVFDALRLLPFGENSSHYLVRDQIDQIPYRQKRVTDALKKLRKEVESEA